MKLISILAFLLFLGSFSTIQSASSTPSPSSTTASPTASSAAAQAYIVTPVDNASRSQLESIEETLGVENCDEIVLNTTSSIFLAVITPAKAATLTNENSAIKSVTLDPSISSDDDPPSSKTVNVTPDCKPETSSKPRKRDDTDVKQYPAAPELRFISQPRNPHKAIGLTRDYVYDSTAGAGITVYVIDDGMNAANPEIARAAQRAGGYRWLWPKKKLWTKVQARVEDDATGHGTCVISKVSGYDFGVAKYAQIVVLKHGRDAEGTIKYSSIVKNLSLVVADVRERKIQGKAVVNLSLAGGFHEQSGRDELRAVLKELLDSNIVVVLASGNHRQENPNIDTYPALLADYASLQDMIIVGAVYADGTQTIYGQGGRLLDVSAPGSLDINNGIQCASGNDSSIVRRWGTSFAAPTVSGLAAYFLALYPALQGENAPRKVKDYIKSTAWSRNGGPKAIWNEKESTLSTAAKRWAGDDAACPNGELPGWEPASFSTGGGTTVLSVGSSTSPSHTASDTISTSIEC